MWLLDVELRTSGRSASVLDHWAISPALVPLLKCIPVNMLNSSKLHNKSKEVQAVSSTVVCGRHAGLELALAGD